MTTGPWEQFQAQQADQSGGPWSQFAPLPQAPKPPAPEPGLMSELERGGHDIYSNLRTALTAPFVGSDVAAKAGAQREEEYNQTAAPSVDILGDVQKAYQDKGILSSIGAGLKDLPALVGQVAPTLAEYSAAEFMAPVVGPAALFLAQHYGQNVAQTAATQMAQNKDVDVDSLKALGYAVPQAALDVAHISIPLGKQVIGKLFGEGVEKAVGKGAMSEAEKLAQEQLAKKSFGESVQDGLKTGLVSGVPIMVAQTALERAYNGDKLFDDDALHQYGSAALSGALMAPLGVLGALSEKSQAVKAVDERNAAAAKAAADAAEAQANQPDNLLKLYNDFQDAKAQQSALQEAIPAKPKKNAPDEEIQAYRDAKDAANQHLNETFKPLQAEYEKRQDAIKATVLSNELTYDQARELAQQQNRAALSQQPTADNLLNAIQPAPTTTMADIAKLRDDHETAMINDLLAKDAEMQQTHQVAKQAVMNSAGSNTFNEDLARTDARVREGRIMARVQGLLDENIPFASTAIQDINNKLSVIGEPPLSPQEAYRVKSIMDMTKAFTDTTKLPGATTPPFVRPTAEGILQKIKPSAMTTMADVAKIRDDHETAIINDLLAKDSEMKQTQDAARQALVDASNQESFNGAVASTDARVREGRIFARVQELIDNNVPFASTAIRDVNAKLQAIGEKPLSMQEVGRIKNIMDTTRAFTDTVNLPAEGKAIAPIEDRTAQNQALENLIPERKSNVNQPIQAGKPVAAEGVSGAPAVRQGVEGSQAPRASNRPDLSAPEGGSPVALRTREKSGFATEPPEALEKVPHPPEVQDAYDAVAEMDRRVNEINQGKLNLRAALRGKLTPEEAFDITPERERYFLQKAKDKGRGTSVSELISNHALDDFLPYDMRPDHPDFDAGAAAEYLKDKYRSGDHVSEADRNELATIEQARQEPERIIDEYEQMQKANRGETEDVFNLEQPTREDILARQEAEEQAAKEQSASEKAAEQQTKEDLEHKEIAQRSEAAAEDFQLGQSAEDNLSGQRNLYRVQGKANGLAQDFVQNLVNRIKSGWVNAPEIVVHADESTLPQHIRDQAERDGVTGQIPGVYDPNTKLVHLVSRNLSGPKDVYATVAHEAAGHFGLREMLGGDYNKTMDRIYEGNKAVREAADEKMKGSNLSRQVATEEVLADMAETGVSPEKQGALRQMYETVKKWFMDKFGVPNMTDNEVKQIVANARKFVIEGGEKGAGNITSEAVYRTKYNPGFEKAADLTKKVLASERPLTERFNKTAFGRASLGWIQKLQDQYRPFLKLTQLKDANGQRLINDSAGNQMMSDLRFYQQRLNFLSSVIQNGALTFKKGVVNGAKRSLYETDGKESLKQVFTELRPADKITGSREATNALYSLWAIAERVRKGGATLEQLNFDPSIVNAKSLKEAMDEINRHPELLKTFQQANETYQNFNANMMKFAVDAGAIPKATADKLLSRRDYVPYYREEPDGTISMMSNGESIFKVGNIKTQPELKALIGGDKRILDFAESSVRNANMLLSMGMRNQAVKNSMFELQKIGLVDIRDKAPKSMDNAVEFKVQGKSKYAVFDDAATEKLNIPTQLFIKGLEGVPTQMSTWLKAMSIPSNILKEMFVANPVSAARIVFKDTMSSALVAGSDFNKIVDSLQSVKDGLMVKRGLSGGQLFTGQPEEIARVLRQAQAGGVNASSALALAHALHAQADATTRQIRYDSYLHQGLNEFDANLMALESMNFTKRGLSPSIHILNALNPFINSQIQGVNTLVAAIRGDMPMQEQLRIKQKILARGAMIAGATMLYSALMQDNKHYRDAMPDQKYSNWYVPFPGLEEPVKIPIPFEAGMLFKSVPEAMVELFMKHDKSAMEGLKMTAIRMVPGLETSTVAQAVRPGLEAYTNTSFQTGETIQSERELKMLPGERIRTGTSGAAQEIGGALNISPVMIDHVIGGYTSSMGMALMHITDGIIGSKMQGAPVASDLSQTPVIGSLFARDGGAILQEAMGKFHELEEVKNTFTALKNAGQTDRAMAFLQANQEAYAKSAMATSAQKQIGNFTKQIEMVVADKNLTGEQKKQRINQIKEQRRDFAQSMLARVS